MIFAAPSSMILRENHFNNGIFAKRYKNGEILLILGKKKTVRMTIADWHFNILLNIYVTELLPMALILKLLLFLKFLQGDIHRYAEPLHL